MAKNRRNFGKDEPVEKSFLDRSDSSSSESESDEEIDTRRRESSSSDSEESNEGGENFGSDDSDEGEEDCSFLQLMPHLNKIRHSIKQPGYKMLVTVITKMLQEVEDDSEVKIIL